MDILVCVGFETRSRDDVESHIPEFQANRGTTNPDTQLRQINEKTDEYVSSASQKLWLSEFRRLELVASVSRENTPDQIVRLSQYVETHKEGISCLHDFFGHQIGLFDAFDPAGYLRHGRVEFHGFDIRRFVKMFGLGAAEARYSVPRDLWYGSPLYKDTREALMPASETKDVPLYLALLRLDVAVPPWFESGFNADRDLRLTCAAVDKLNLAPQHQLMLREFDDKKSKSKSKAKAKAKG